MLDHGRVPVLLVEGESILGLDRNRVPNVSVWATATRSALEASWFGRGSQAQHGADAAVDGIEQSPGQLTDTVTKPGAIDQFQSERHGDRRSR